jgi:hypothetical protein
MFEVAKGERQTAAGYISGATESRRRSLAKISGAQNHSLIDFNTNITPRLFRAHLAFAFIITNVRSRMVQTLPGKSLRVPASLAQDYHIRTIQIL